MRTMAVWIAAPLLLGITPIVAGNQSAIASDDILGSYFPIALKNQWTYVLAGANDPGQEELVQVVGMNLVGDKEVFLTDNYSFGFVTEPIEFGTDDLGRTCEHRDGKWAVWYPWVDKAPVALPSFGFEDCMRGAHGTMIRMSEITVPAGTFHNVFRIDYHMVPCCDAGLVSETFAPGIGLVERTLITFIGHQTWQLSTVFLQDASGLDEGVLPVAASTWGAIKGAFNQ